jgi:hypothetical protein
MAIQLDPSQTKAFTNALMSVVPDLAVVYGRYIIDATDRIGAAIESGLPKSPKARSKTGLDQLSDTTLERFVLERLELSLPAPLVSTENRLSFEQAVGSTEVERIVSSVTSDLCTLPWSYRLMAPTMLEAQTDSSHTVEWLPANGYSLRSFSATDAADLPLHLPDLIAPYLFNQVYPEKVKSDRYYFTRDIVGYISTRRDPSIDEFVDAVKGFLGLCVVTGLLVTRSGGTFGRPSASPVMVHRTDGQLQLLPYHWLSAEDSELLLRYVEPDTNERGARDARLSAVLAAFAHQQTRSSARWLLDSEVGSNGLLQVVQATISLEILLGDQRQAGELGVVGLLANRLAYFVGKTPSERDALLSEFKKLYDLRSQIVHAGKAVLSDKEGNAVYRLRALARRCLSQQIFQLAEASKS